MYLTRKGKSKVVHIWNGKDTNCRMYSTGGMRQEKYHVVTELNGRKICELCESPREKAKDGSILWAITGKYQPLCNCDVLPWEDCIHTLGEESCEELLILKSMASQ